MSCEKVARRGFLLASALAGPAAAACGANRPPATPTLAPSSTSSPTVEPSPTSTPAPLLIEKRSLAETGWELSVVGFGGIVVMSETDETAKQYVARAIARGINYFDVAPSYGDAQNRLGPALEPYRKDVFLSCKTESRTKAGAEGALKRSLELLRTDHVDLYQFHAVTSERDVEQIMAEDGAMRAFLEARDKGLIGLIGFSAHSESAALDLMARFSFDTILYPVNWACWQQGGFGPQVVRRAADRGMGILALKSLARGQWQPGEEKKWYKCWYAPLDDPRLVSLALRFTLSKSVTAAVSPSHAELLWLACDVPDKLAPLSEGEENELRSAVGEVKPVFTA